ncbi:MAG TPA: PASTA domain-containing protein [bacterium]|nr:PASTA domain-containing protein [bacterium]
MIRRLLTYLAVFAAAILAVALLINFVMAVLVGGKQVDVPDVRGLSERDAFDALRRSGLTSACLGTEYSSDYPDSTVMIQDPPAGRNVKQGRKVFITLSRGPELRAIPYCVGKTLRTAELFIERSGFTVGALTMVTKDGTYDSEVIATDPPAGQSATSGKVVNILASKGLPRTKYILPDLTGKSLEAVRIQLGRLGVAVRQAGEEDEFTSARARVRSQEPPAGFFVGRGDTITVSVSSGSGGHIQI